MRIIYCDSVIDNKVIEPDYESEKDAAIKAGFQVSIFSFEEILEGNINRALRYIKKAEKTEVGIYRGWMMTPVQYGLLYHGLLDKNIQLINSPAAYQHCHYLPASYDKIKTHTPVSSWLKISDTVDMEKVFELTDEFGEAPIIVKDYVKSEKHHWEEACFIPNAADKSNVESIVSTFLELRGDALNEGLVFRKFLTLEYLTNHAKSGMPLTKEYRIFFAHKKIISVFNYWDEGEYGDTQPDLDIFLEIAQQIESNFFTIDVAKKKSGGWIIMELGDGQVAGLPDNADKEGFYQEIFHRN